MEYRYLNIKPDGKGFEISKQRVPNEDYAFKCIDGSIFWSKVYDAIVLSDDLVSIGGMNFYINTLKPIPMDQVTSLESVSDDDKLILKNSSHKLPDPYKERLAPFASAVVMACLTQAKSIALTKEEHQNKLSIIRMIRGLVGTDTDITLKKAEELLHYYGLEIKDLLKDELVVNKG